MPLWIIWAEALIGLKWLYYLDAGVSNFPWALQMWCPSHLFLIEICFNSHQFHLKNDEKCTYSSIVYRLPPFSRIKSGMYFHCVVLEVMSGIHSVGDKLPSLCFCVLCENKRASLPICRQFFRRCDRKQEVTFLRPHLGVTRKACISGITDVGQL